MTADQHESPPKLLDAEAVAALLKVRPLTITRWLKRGSFPRPIQPGGKGGRRFWPEEAVHSYLRGRGPAG